MPPLLSNETIALLQCEPVNFNEVFDALFVRGGFAAYTAEYGERDCGRFYDDFETETNDLLMQAICACRLMQVLPHPGFGVLLLQGEHSRHDAARAHAERCCLRVVDWRVLILAMRIFCPLDSCTKVWEGFHASQLHTKRSKAGWVEFARARYWDRMFLKRWRLGCKVTGVDMRDAITMSAEKEIACLPVELLNRERAVLMAKKELDAKQRVEPDAAKKRKYTPRPVVLSKKDEVELLALVEKEEVQHRYVLAKLAHVLATKQIRKIGARLAGIVGALARLFPLIAWNLKETIHKAAVERSAFATEQKLLAHRLDLAPRASVVRDLERMV